MPIGCYALGPISLPHPPFPRGTLYVIESAITEAWRIIRDHPVDGFRVDQADEDSITQELRSCLMDNVLHSGAVAGFNSDLFRVARDAKFESFDRAHKDLMPDLHIDVLQGRSVSIPSADGLFVECKPVGSQHPAGTKYCKEGISRFVRGDYGWALSEGLMVGYASPGYTLPKKLEEAITPRKTALKLSGPLKACPDTTAQGYRQHPHITVHRRGFTYRQTKGKAPKITIRHLWLNRA